MSSFFASSRFHHDCGLLIRGLPPIEYERFLQENRIPDAPNGKPVQAVQIELEKDGGTEDALLIPMNAEMDCPRCSKAISPEMLTARMN